MSLIFFDGFDGYDAGSDLANFGSWIYSAGGGISSIVRAGTGKSAVWSAHDYRYLYTSAQSGNTLFIGLAYSPTTAHTASNTIFIIVDSGNADQLILRTTAVGRVEVARGPTILTTGTTILAVNSWYYIEFKILIASSGGICDCKINGTTEFTFLGNTQNLGTNINEGIRTVTNAGALVDDLYICNSAGSLNNTYLGEVLCRNLPPTGDTTANFTRNAGASNYLAIDDPLGAPDDATTYVYATTSGIRDEYTLTNTSETNTIFGVKVNTRAQKSDVNAKSFKHGIKTGANQQHATRVLAQGYTNYQDIYETSDGAGTAWTTTTLDAAVSTLEVV